MRPLLHPVLVNGRFGDPALYVETLFERYAILFDLGDIGSLPARKVQRIEYVFVSHAHIDHFFGFDRLLRLLVGREKTIQLYGPDGFVDRVYHKLQGYHWDLFDRYACDLIFTTTEIDASYNTNTVRFRLKNSFAREEIGCDQLRGRILHRNSAWWVSTAMLQHHGPCLGFALEEAAHINIWKNRLDDMGLPVGPWLRSLKRAVIDKQPDDYPIALGPASSNVHRDEIPLGELRDVLTVTPGQKIGYITDAADTPQNRDAILRLVRDADILFIEAAFAAADADLAAKRAHLTTAAAGDLGREARVRRVEPLHFSPRYEKREEQMLAEVMTFFLGHK